MTEPDRRRILRLARLLGCKGTHVGPDGILMPCGSHEELVAASTRSEPIKRQRRADIVRNGLASAPETLPNGGLVSGTPSAQTKAAKLVDARPVDPMEKEEAFWKPILERHNMRAKKAKHPWAVVSPETAKTVLIRGRAYGNDEFEFKMAGRKRLWWFLRVSQFGLSYTPDDFVDWDLLSPQHPARRKS